jgi:hypothetical protein
MSHPRGPNFLLLDLPSTFAGQDCPRFQNHIRRFKWERLSFAAPNASEVQTGTLTSLGHDCRCQSGTFPFRVRACRSKSGHLPFSPTICRPNPYIPSRDHTCGSEPVPLPLPAEIAAPNPWLCLPWPTLPLQIRTLNSTSTRAAHTQPSTSEPIWIAVV